MGTVTSKTSDLSVRIGRIRLKNPVMAASGTFGYGEEYKDLIDLKKLGAIVTKSLTLKSRQGNPSPRICETSSGMLNAIGLHNSGIEDFISEKIPYLKRIKIPFIVSIAGGSVKEYQKLTERLDHLSGIAGLEINISCPNVEPRHKSKLMFAQDPDLTYKVVKQVRRKTKITLITKLSPNVTDIVSVARAARDAGTDAISLINSVSAMAVDIKTMRPRLANITGGLTGPAIKPIALRAVWEVSRKVNLPLIGMGGIMDWQDALEFIICGATAVVVGTANFVNPLAASEIVDGLDNYLKEKRINNINKLVGKLKI